MNNIGLDDLRREFFRESPKDVDGVFNSSNLYYSRFLLKKIFSLFLYDNVPGQWDVDYINTHFFLDGYFAVLDTDIGVIPLKCGYTGINVFEHPTTCVFANPILGNFERKIGIDCVLIHAQWDYGGIWDLITRYATLLAMCDSAISVSLMNSKATFFGFANDKAQADSMKKMYDKISLGEPAVFVKKGMQGEFYFQNVKQSFVAPDVQILKRQIINEFLTEIGVDNANLDKRERLNSDEVNANNIECDINIYTWFSHMKSGLASARKMFPELNVDVRLNTYALQRIRADLQSTNENGGEVDESE